MTRLQMSGLQILFATMVATFAACGGGGEVAPDDLDTEIIDSTCERLVRCGEFESLAACQATLNAYGLGVGGALLAGVENGSIDYDGEKARECLEAIAAASCDESAENARNDPAACAEAFSGTVADGGACVTSLQCVSERCVGVDDCEQLCCEGTCAPTVPVAALGQSCADAECERGTYCDDSSTCSALAPDGSPCDYDEECDYGLVCVVGELGGSCAAAPQAGDPCLSGEECVVIGLACNFATVTCERLLHEGATCDPENSLCSSAYLRCDAATMKCLPYPGIGQACPDFVCSGDAYCDYDFQLATSECKARLANGTACDNDYACASRYCDQQSSTCADAPVCI